MKKNLYLNLYFSFLILNFCTAQAPQAIPYQAVARNASGNLIASQAVSVRFSIIDSIATGTVVYSETFHPTTNTLGLFSINIGQGTVVSGSFAAINWGTNNKFLKVELDPAGGNSYNDMGTTQMMSVPYAIYAGNSNNGVSAGMNLGDMLYWNGSAWTKVPVGLDGYNLSLCNSIPIWGGCPTIITTPISSTSINSVTSGGNITSGSSIFSRGVCWNTSPNPTIANSFTSNGTGSGNFISNITGLTPNILYYVRAYATIGQNTFYGNQISFSSTSSLDSSLISYYKLDGNSNDAVGSINGTNTSITFSSGNGKINQGAGFNGTTSGIQNNTAIDLPTNATISCWFKTTQTPSGANPLIYGYRAGNGNPKFILVLTNGTSQVNLYCADSNVNEQIVNSGTALNNGNWHFLVGVKSGGIISLYVDGLFISSMTTTYTGNFYNTTMAMGHNPFNSEYYSGSIDECGFWGRALTAAEISTLYNSGNGLSFPF